MNDELDFETRLRSGLAHHAASIDVPPPDRAVSVAEGAVAVRSVRHRRRMVMTSVATVAAVSAGLVVISRDPGTQDVSTDAAPAAAGLTLAGGAATGSSSGSASGSPRGWTTVAGGGSSDAVPPFALRVGEGLSLDGYFNVREQRDGQPAADLAVAADVRPDAPLRFVVASVQDASRLTSGKGGTVTTIEGRPARIISRRAATLITWDLSDDKRVLVYAGGVDDATLVAWLRTLAPGDDGRWRFADDATDGGLVVVPTETPDGQRSNWLGWNRYDLVADQTCAVTGHTLTVSSGGAYELWGQLAEMAVWSQQLPTVSEEVVAGELTASVVFATPYGGLLTRLDDQVIRLSSFAADPADATSVADDVALLYRPTAEEWAAAVGAAPQSPSDPCASIAPTTVPTGGSGEVEATAPPTTSEATGIVPPPTPAPTPAPTTTVTVTAGE